MSLFYKFSKILLDNGIYIVYNAFRCRRKGQVPWARVEMLDGVNNRIGNGCTDGYLRKMGRKCIRNYKTEVYIID